MFCGKIVAFELFPGDKGEYIGLWMMKIMIKAVQR